MLHSSRFISKKRKKKKTRLTGTQTQHGKYEDQPSQNMTLVVQLRRTKIKGNQNGGTGHDIALGSELDTPLSFDILFVKGKT
jgi:hypothetical protein